MSTCSGVIWAVWRRRIGILAAIIPAILPAAAQPLPFTVQDLWQWREIVEPRIAPDASHVAYLLSTPSHALDSFESRLWVVSTSGSGSSRVLSPAGSTADCPRWSPDSTRIAWISTRDGLSSVVVRRISEERETAIPAPGAETLAWSEDGAQLAYTAQVQEPLPNSAWAPVSLRPQLRVRRTRLFLVKASGGEPTPVSLGDLEPTAEPGFFGDGRGLLLSLGKPGETPDLYTLHLPDFALRRLTTPSGLKFEPVPSPDGSRIAWLAKEVAARSYQTAKLWVANHDGSRARTLAGALDRDPGRPWWSSDSRTVYFIAQDRGEARVFAARNDGSVRPVLSAAGLRELSLADNGRAAAVRDSGELIFFAADLPGESRVLVAPNRELLSERAVGTVEAFEYTAGAFRIQAWLTRPPGFDAARKYPVLLDIDDSPRRMCGPAFQLRNQVFTAAGMIVVCANARGAPGYGEAFGNLIDTGFPGDPVDDWLAGIDALAAKPYFDPARVRIAGGVSAAWAIGHTKRFESAVLRRAAVDLTVDPGSLTIRPWDDPGYFAAHSPLNFAAAVTTPTLILASPDDLAAQQFAVALKKVDHSLLRIGQGRPADLVEEWEATLAWFGREFTRGLRQDRQ